MRDNIPGKKLPRRSGVVIHSWAALVGANISVAVGQFGQMFSSLTIYPHPSAGFRCVQSGTAVSRQQS